MTTYASGSAETSHWVLREPPPEPLNESELSWIWAGQRYPAGALGLVDGRTLRVVYPGRPGGGAGPDFLDAVLEIDGATVTGDVELHVRSSWFRAHGHDTDAAYDGVALHVVFRADDGPGTRLHSGAQAPVAAFAPWFDNRRDELQRWLGAEALWSEPCGSAARRLGEERVRAVLAEAGRRRFEAKARSLRAMVADTGEDEALWRACFDAIGVGGDREGFRRLAVAFPERLARAVLATDGGSAVNRLTAALIYAAGLGPADGPGIAEKPTRLRPPLAGSGRPANRPERRLAGLAALYGRAGGDLAEYVRRSVRDAGRPAELVTAWQASNGGVSVIGAERARELALNVALPFAWTDAGLSTRAEELLGGLAAAPAYGKTLFLERQLKPENGKRMVKGVLEQQGLLAFLGEWCSQGGCGRCPLS